MGPAPVLSPRADVEDLLALSHALGEVHGLDVDPLLVGEAARLASLAGAGRWRLLTDALAAVGLAVTPVAAPLADLVRRAAPSAPLVGDTPAGWRLVLEARGRRALVADPADLEAATWVPLGALAATLGVEGPRAPVTLAAVHPALPVGGHGHDEGHDAPPWRKLVALLRPEAADVRTILILSVGTGLLALATPIAVQQLVNTVAFGGLLQPVVVLALALLACLTLLGALRALQVWVAEVLQRRLLVRLVSDLAHRLPRAAPGALDGQHGPERVNRFFDVLTLQKTLTTLLLESFGLLLGAAAGMVVLAFYHPVFLALDVVLAGAVAVVVVGLGRGAVDTSVAESASKYELAAWLEELARGGAAFRDAAGRRLAADRTDALARRYLAARGGHFRIVLRQTVAALALQALASTALLGLGGWLVMAGSLTLGQLVAAELIVTLIVGSVAKLGKHLESFYDLLTATEKLAHLVDLPLERSGGEARPDGAAGAATARLEGAEAGLAGGPAARLSLAAGPGERVALRAAAAPGAGPLLDALAGLRPLAAGAALVDGVDLRGADLERLRGEVALVRGADVFAGTVLDNVRAGREGVTLACAREALRAVGLWDEVAALPQGVNTPLLPGGAPLVEAQARRVALARALAGRPRLLLLDGALDALPVDARAACLEAVFTPGRPWTVLVATEDEEVLRRCDRTVLVGGSAP